MEQKIRKTSIKSMSCVNNYSLSSVDWAAPEVMAKLIKGEVVNPESVYFRCVPRFETSSPALRWISERMFIGTGARHPDRVVMRFFEVA